MISLPIRWCDAGHHDAKRGVVTSVSDRGDVVDQRVVPDVEDVLLVPGDGYPPAQRRARDRDVPQAPLDEPERLVPLARRSHGVGSGVVPLEQAILERAELEEIVLLFHLDHRSSVHGTVAVDELLLGVVVLAGHAVEPAVGAELDVAVVVDRLEEASYGEVVTRLGGANEVVVGDVQVCPGGDEPLSGGVGPGLGGHPVLPRRLGHLGPVLVGAGEEEHVVAEEAVPPAERVGVHRRVGVPDVRRVVDVVDRRGEEEARHRRYRTGGTTGRRRERGRLSPPPCARRGRTIASS